MLVQLLALGLLAIKPLYAAPGGSENRPDDRDVCRQLERVVSSKYVYYQGNVNYDNGISHWLNSSSQAARCVVEPGKASEVAEILQILGGKGGCGRTNFAIKAGGHTSNPGFSSTADVHIYLRRFNKVYYDKSKQTVEIGAGNLWDDVYHYLDPYGVSVVGGRSNGVGAAGVLLGGGYSWKTSQYGLSVDTITSYKLVKPDGNVVVVTASSDPDLFFALKGGGNNFGIVTKFTMKAVPQTQIWGGVVTFMPDQLDNANAAVAAFSSEVTDPKAGILMAYVCTSGIIIPSLQIFYDGPTPPSGVFDRFLSLQTISVDVKARSFLDFFLAGDSSAGAPRGLFDTVSLQAITPEIIRTIIHEAQTLGPQLASASGTLLVFLLEPLLPTAYTHSTSATAFPFTRSHALMPLEVFFGWTDSSADGTYKQAIKQSIATIMAAAVAQGQTEVPNLPPYPNYSIYDTSLERLYGSNLAKLRTVKARVDKNNVMGLTGGFRL